MRVMFNEDWIHFFWTRYTNNIEVTKEYLKEFIYQYKDTSITDFAMNINGTVSSFPSKVFESFCDKYTATVENGITVNYRDTFAATAYDIFVKKQLDMYRIWIETLHETGKKAWLSFRINDCHYNWQDTNVQKSSYIERHKELWRQAYREPDYFGKCFNYAVKDVRDRFCRYIEEALERYDVDGIELDCMRELFAFVPGEENRGIITELFKEIKKTVTAAEKRRKHSIKISALVAAEPKTNFEAGFDVAEWVKNGLADQICAIPRWETITTDIPIEFWKSLLGDTPFAAGQQLLFAASREMKARMSSVDMAYGQSMANMSRGADFIYLYNHFDLTEPGLEGFLHSTAIRPDSHSFLCDAGKPEMLKRHIRRYPLSYDDFPNYWERVNCRLPINCKKDFFENIRISVGDLSGDNALLQLGTDSELTVSPKIFVNGHKAEPTAPKPDFNIYGKNWYAFKIPQAAFGTHVVVEMCFGSECRLEYAEIFAEPKN